ncbi:MAG: type IV pilus modification protein PilV [Betaproteobacteria bacterium]
MDSQTLGHRRGFVLIEVMVTVVLLSIGLMGLAALHARTTAAQVESYQRIQALLLAQDMAERIAADKGAAPALVGDGYGSGPETGCAALTGSALDACNWGNALRGTGEKLAGQNAGTLLRGRGCISATAPNRYLVVVAWQGVQRSAAPAASCGDGSYGDETLRRTVAVPVHLADLSGT